LKHSVLKSGKDRAQVIAQTGLNHRPLILQVLHSVTDWAQVIAQAGLDRRTAFLQVLHTGERSLRHFLRPLTEL